MRNIQLDALRAFAILGVVTLHLVGGVTTLPLNVGNEFVTNIILAITYCSVNLFGMLSGYLKIDREHHYATITRIILQTAFWCFLFTIVCALFFQQRSVRLIIGNAFPFVFDRLWYINCYFFVFLCVPYLNLLLNSLSESGYRKMLFIAVFLMSFIPTLFIKDFFHVISHGYSAGWLIFMYIIGGYCKKYGFPAWLTKKIVKYLLIGSVFIVVLSKYVIEILLRNMGLNTGLSLLFYYYCSPFMVLNSICFLYLFVTSRLEITIFTRAIIWLSEVSLGIYIIHAHPFCLDYLLVGRKLTWLVHNNPIVTCLLLLLMVGIIAISTGVLEYMRIIIFRTLGIDKIVNKIGLKLDKLMAFN